MITKRILRTWVLGLTITCVGSSTAQEQDNNTYRQLNLFGDIFERIRSDYVEKVSDEKLIESAINGMLTSLDPHSSYLNPKNFKDMQTQTRGEFGGLGIEVTMENGLVKVVSPIDDTPAYRAGIKSGDLISHLDGEPVQGLSLSETVERMRGKAGSRLKLKILREGLDPFEVIIIRAIIKIKSVRWRMEGPDIGYIRITSFSEQTISGLEKAVGNLKKLADSKLKGLILDLRNNPGGLLEQSVKVSDAFLNKGEIVSTRSRRADQGQRFNARPGDIIDGLPIVILMNGGSASASEIVAGALQDHRRAIIMGTRSFGKGSVQTIVPLSGHGAIRLTTARYYTPSGRSIQATGINPDIVVQQAKLEKLKEPKRKREENLRGRLGNPKTTKPDSGPSTKKHLESYNEKQDYQLSRALNLLRGITLYNLNAVK